MGTFDDALEDLFETFDDCQDATYIPLTGDPVSCRVNLTKEVDSQPLGSEGQTWSNLILLEYRLDEVGKRAIRGDIFKIGSVEYKVDSVYDGDSRLVKVAVLE